ncbi:MAG: hypothetical protein NC331_11475 [Lachnospiraceae bacterium]|nr:hypothetical protein [Lachnospiraceae bacterium]MCM1239988.1 hypothetical protein [Lachnospiraceae bacterium]
MNGMATREQLVGKLYEAVRMTRAGMSITGMDLDGEYVTIHYEGGIKKVPVGGDSGIALMRDVLRYIH